MKGSQIKVKDDKEHDIDFLSKIFEAKREFEEQYYDLKGMSDKERETLSQRIITMMIVECVELLREMDYKLLPTEKVIINKEKLNEELMDIGHFYFFLCLLWDFDETKFYEAFMEKDTKIRERNFLISKEGEK